MPPEDIGVTLRRAARLEVQGADTPLPGDHEPPNPNHHRVILALSTAFWDAYLCGDAAALAWLNGPGPRSVLEPADQWQFSTPHQPAR